jgi:hypothetical protein
MDNQLLKVDSHNSKGGNMEKGSAVRLGWIKFLYIYTIVVAGGFGLGIILHPNIMTDVFGWPTEEPIVIGIVGSTFLAFAIISIFGLRSPLKFLPILILQLCYKVVWFLGVILPMAVTEQFQNYGYLAVIIFATFILFDLIAIPFRYIFSK